MLFTDLKVKKCRFNIVILTFKTIKNNQKIVNHVNNNILLRPRHLGKIYKISMSRYLK